ncbi:uncharacterized protein C16orf74 homolog [Suncus etruscus]|uniref:uncharacterized protein C16orf74 homolog n=1 Tax=Suncus etruscus TaxID=109475 RepID=UPI0021107AC4|nr:uncharacterized protein C16orf74 homolog [Suncus etruscus]
MGMKQSCLKGLSACMDSDGQDEAPVLGDKNLPLPQIIITPPTPTVLTVLHKDNWQRTAWMDKAGSAENKNEDADNA